ncbi:MAG: HAMP domain-containing sensor histidine kinase [Acidobacteriota bacterium]
MLASDEFSRRTANELGYSGFYPLITALRQAPASAAGPDFLAAHADEGVRKARDLVAFTFRFDPAAARLETLGPEPGAATRAWLAGRLAARPAPQKGVERRYETITGDVTGSLRFAVLSPVDASAGSPVVGFGVATEALAARFQRALARGSLFPPSLSHGALGNDALSLRVFDPAGREIFRAGVPKEPYLGVERPFASDYNGMLDGFVVRAAVDAAAAPALVIGGLPRSRLPLLLGLLALTAGLIVTAILQLRRERALAQLRSDFVSRVSHELRTPLTQIRMFAETLLLDRVRTPGERRRSLEIIDREARRLANLVENILRFSREERGEDRIDARERDVVPLVRRLLADFEPLVAGRARIEVTLPEQAVACVDEEALQQILLNLLDNAVKYGPEGQVVRLSVVAAGSRVVFSVEDEGPGIPESERARIFEPYYRLPRDRSSSVAGTGIGLAVVADLARLQGGEARVEGTPRGVRFAVELPAAAPAAGAG